LVEKVARTFFIQSESEVKQKQSKHNTQLKTGVTLRNEQLGALENLAGI